MRDLIASITFILKLPAIAMMFIIFAFLYFLGNEKARYYGNKIANGKRGDEDIIRLVRRSNELANHFTLVFFLILLALYILN